ncbi:MAG: AmmeMemoRadiSam system radical SAM enzyme [Pontibacterium sp.]
MSTIEVGFSHPVARGKIQCDLCPRFCQLSDGQRGLCFVRGNLGGKMQLYTYGRSSGFCIDPIEKKPLNHYLPGTPVLSFGTAGCNLACKFCQNWDISKAREMDKLADAASPEQLAKFCHQHACRSIAYTYNDPIIFMEYAEDVAKACHQYQVNSVAVSAGYISDQARPRFFRHMDAANIDLKAFTDHFYKHICGGHLAPVLDTLLYIHNETSVWLEITTLLIPGENDSNQEIDAMTRWIFDNLGPSVPLHFSAFHPDWKMLTTAPTPIKTLTRARDIAMKNGLRYVYTGNVHDTEGSSTYCHKCGQCLIERDWYRLGAWNLKDGCCNRCNEPLPGHFERRPGDWGDKRQPVFLGGDTD